MSLGVHHFPNAFPSFIPSNFVPHVAGGNGGVGGLGELHCFAASLLCTGQRTAQFYSPRLFYFFYLFFGSFLL